MNIQEIQTGNFSSVKGSWRNEQGNSITFDANGLIQVNGKPAGDVVFDKFVVKGEKLTAVTKTSEGISETPIVFTPSGQDGRESIFGVKIMSVMERIFIIESRRLVTLLNHKKESLFISGSFKILQKVDYFCIIFELWVFIKKIILFF